MTGHLCQPWNIDSSQQTYYIAAYHHASALFGRREVMCLKEKEKEKVERRKRESCIADDPVDHYMKTTLSFLTYYLVLKS
jgi:hypothetical protein